MNSAPVATSRDESEDELALAELLRRRVLRLVDELGDVRIEGLYAVVMRELERGLLQAALETTGGRRAEAAALLGLHRNSLRRRLRATGLESEASR